MSFSPREFLQHMLDETDYLIERSSGISRREFLEDGTLRRAFVRSLEVVGEATKKLPSEFVERHPEIEWRSMAGMRDRLIHGYFGVDHDLVWDVVRNKIPELAIQVRRILEQPE